MVDVYVDANSGPLASGIGIIAKATGGNITAVTNFKTTGESTSASKGYGIFPGQITFDDGGVPAYNTPVGQCDIDPNGLGTPNVGLEFGALYKHTVAYPAVDPNAPLAYTRLCTLTVSSGVTKVDVVGNELSCGKVGSVAAGIITEGALGTYVVNASISLALPAPTVTGITPSTGVYGTTVTISNLAGTNFVATPNVKLTKSGQADIPVTVAFVSATKLTGSVVLPYLAIAGSWDVVVTNPDAQFATKAAAFVVTAPAAVPTVTSILSSGGAAGTTVAILDLKGTNFVAGATVQLTKTDQSSIAAANVVRSSATKITCDLVLPAGTVAGTWNVVVTNPDARFATLTNGFTVGDCLMDASPTTSAQHKAYVTWVAFNKPSCWCYKLHCKGDGNGASFNGIPVTSADLTLYKEAFGKDATTLGNVSVGGVKGICADFNHAAFNGISVTSADLNIYKDNFGKSGLANCATTYINFWTN